jgi:cytochrome P450
MDLTDPDIFVRGEHHAGFGWLRKNEPVYWQDAAAGTGFWSLTRYADVLAAYRDHTTFSSSGGAVLGGSFRSERDTAAGRMLVASDLPRHRLLRQAVYPMFAAESANRVAVQVATLVDRAIGRMLADGGCDFATDVATELPAGALMATLDIGHQEAHELIGLTRKMIGFRDPTYVDVTDDERLRLAWLQSEVFEFFTDLARVRRTRPGDDLVSVLLRARLNGRPMTEEEVLFNCMNVAVGGNETSSYTAGSGVVALAEHPAEYDRLLAAPALLEPALAEILRWSSTNAYVQRVATRDVKIRGRLIRSGDPVALWNVSANRDEDQFPGADRFDIGRSPNRHLSLGSGIHRCIGAPVGQAELSILFDRLVSKQIRLAISGPVRPLRSNFILGPTRLPVTVAGQ